MKAERVLVLGIDGGDLALFRRLGMRVLEVLERRGRVAALQRIWREDRGWAMILCGQDGSVSGGYYWAQVPETYLFKQKFGAADYAAEPLWSKLDAAGVPAAFISVPTTFPPQPLRRGLFIAGAGGGQYPELEECVHPRSLLDTDADLFDGARLDVRNLISSNLTPEAFVHGLVDETRTKERLVCGLFERYQLQFAMTVLVGADRIQHLLWPQLEDALRSRDNDRYGILEYFDVLDQTLIRMIERYSDEAHVVLCSDHGFAPRRFEVSVNALLAEMGFQRPRFGAGRSLSAQAESRFKDRVGERMRRLYRRLRPWRGHSPPRLDWSQTQAFVNTAAGIWVNTSDRFPQGSVAPRDRDKLVGELLDHLRDVPDPRTGGRLFTRLAAREDAYSGPQRHRAPDVVFDMDETYEVVNDLDSSIVREFRPAPLYSGILPRTMSGIHGTGGLFGVVSPVVKPGEGPQNAGYPDVHEVLLSLLGLGNPPVLLTCQQG